MFRWYFKFSHLDVHAAYMSAAKYIPNIMYNTIGQMLNMSWSSSSFPSSRIRIRYVPTGSFCSGIYANFISPLLEMAETDEMLKLRFDEAL